ncbi:MAG: hypothetical protein ABJB09_05110 [Verrucomicrobiota bacterium]
MCDEIVPRGALACPECGADYRSGWREETAAYDGLDMPDENFDYDEFVRQEFGNSPKPARLKLVWWFTGLLLLAAFLLLYFYR